MAADERVTGSPQAQLDSQQPPQHAEPEPAPGSSGKKKRAKKLLSEAKLRRLKEVNDRRGVVYISRLPPHMKPGKLRQLLAQHGELGRVYCTPEDRGARKQRKKRSGNTGKSFSEGWVEFEDKAVAKAVAAALNGQPMGGKRRSAFHFDLWAIKYLPKFKWDHLTEEVAYEKAVREQRMAQELAAAKRERDFYLGQVDRSKAQAAMEQRRKAKAQQAAGEAGEAGAAAAVPSGDGAGARTVPTVAAAGAKRGFGQRRVKPDASQPGAAAIADDVLGLLAPRPSKRARSSRQQAAGAGDS